MRKVMFAMYEFERDLIVARLMNGLKQKLDKAKLDKNARKGQNGAVKVNGRCSLLEKAQPSVKVTVLVKKACAENLAGKLTARDLALKLSTYLKLKGGMAMETARRMSAAQGRSNSKASKLSPAKQRLDVSNSTKAEISLADQARALQAHQATAKTRKTAMKQRKVVIYARTSSKKSNEKLSVSQRRQRQTCESLVRQWLPPAHHQKAIQCVSDVCSGTLPLSQRKGLCGLFDNKECLVYMESARALARKASVAEDIWLKSKDAGVQLEAADLPGLLKHNPTPAEGFMRRVMFAMYEFERDLIVARLANGLKQKLEKAQEDAAQAAKARKEQSRSMAAAPCWKSCSQL
jgi:DNA invertase Pin-like site-specific DNA recombinase